MTTSPKAEARAIYIQFSDCGQHIRRWSLEPFEGGTAFRDEAPSEPAMREALGKSIAFCAYNVSDPLAIRFEFANEDDRLAAANAVDAAFLLGAEGIRAALSTKAPAEQGEKPWSATETHEADAEWIKDIAALELTEDGLSLRTPYDGDADGDGREIIVGGEVIATFEDSSFGEAVRDFLMHSARKSAPEDVQASVPVEWTHSSAFTEFDGGLIPVGYRCLIVEKSGDNILCRTDRHPTVELAYAHAARILAALRPDTVGEGE